MDWFNSLAVSGALTVIFICHGVAFGVLAGRRPEKRRRYRLLTGTFICLSLLYGLRSAVKAGWFAAVPMPLVLVLRVTAIACTLLALLWRSPTPGEGEAVQKP